MVAEPSGGVPRHRVEHVQHLAGPESLEAMRAAGVVAVTNPLHLLPDLDIIQAALGKERSRSDLAFPSSALMKVLSRRKQEEKALGNSGLRGGGPALSTSCLPSSVMCLHK